MKPTKEMIERAQQHKCTVYECSCIFGDVLTAALEDYEELRAENRKFREDCVAQLAQRPAAAAWAEADYSRAGAAYVRVCKEYCAEDGRDEDAYTWNSAAVKAALDAVADRLTEPAAAGEPLAIRLPCPKCGELHIDVGEFATKVHHTHACQHCGHVWRPAVSATVGVRFLPGFKNEPDSVAPAPARTESAAAATVERLVEPGETVEWRCVSCGDGLIGPYLPRGEGWDRKVLVEPLSADVVHSAQWLRACLAQTGMDSVFESHVGGLLDWLEPRLPKPTPVATPAPAPARRTPEQLEAVLRSVSDLSVSEAGDDALLELVALAKAKGGGNA